MARIFITGIAGFIGYHTALALHKRGDVVTGLDNFNAYYDPHLKRQRAQMLEEMGIEVNELDLCEKEQLAHAIDAFAPTCVLNLAAQAGVRHARVDPNSYLKSNLEGFLALLEVLKTRSDISCVYASSSSVYGCNEKIPFAEKDRTDLPANLYAATKKANELLAYSYHHLYGLRCTGLRYFTVYGPWGRPDMAYYSFAKKILEGRPIHLFNEGKMARDFTYIDDIVAGTIAAIDWAAPFEVFNLGNSRAENLFDFVAVLEELLGQSAEIVLEGPSAGEVATTFADISHAQEVLGYNPQTSLREGLSQFVSWLESQAALR